MKKIVLIFFMFLLTLSTSVQAAVVIPLFERFQGGGDDHGPETELFVDYDLYYGNDISSKIFDDFHVFPSASGKSFTINATNDPGFDRFVDFITDGSNSSIVQKISLLDSIGGTLRGSTEVNLYKNLATTDLRGFTVREFILNIDNVFFQTEPHTDIPGREFFTTYGFDMEFLAVVEDGGRPAPIPEPATMALVGTGLLGLVLRRKK